MIRQSAATDQYKYNIIYWPDWRCYINTIAPPISYPPLLHTAHRCGSGKQSLVKQGRDISECRGSALQPVTPSICNMSFGVIFIFDRYAVQYLGKFTYII